MDLVGLQEGSLAAVVDDLGGKEVELYVGVRHTRVTPDEASGLQVGGGGGAGPVEEPLNPHLDHPQSLLFTVETHRLGAALDDVELQVVLQVAADTREVVERLDTNTSQLVTVPHTRQQQQLGRVDGSSTQYDLL